jgi:hypothetical protein
MSDSLSRRTSIGFALALFVLSLDAHAQQATGTAAITGEVTDATTGRPIGGAIVTLEEQRYGQQPRSYVQLTTARGRFAFLDLAASETYFLKSSKPGYLDGGYARPDPRGSGTPIALKDGQWLANVRVTMSRPGSISGAITDERGEPIVGASVRVLPQVLVAGKAQWLAGAAARTDDRGVYRIAGLGPGKYIVSVPSVQATLPATATLRSGGGGAGTSMADLRAAAEAARAEKLVVDVGGGQQAVVGRYTVPPPPAPDGQRTAYPITFYPGVTNFVDATPVELRLSEDRQGVDIHQQPVRTARVSGVVQGSDSLGNLQLRLMPVGLDELGQGSEAATTVTLADGRFTFLDVPSGSYVLELRHTLLEFTYTAMENMSTALPAPVPFSARSATSMSNPAAAPPGVEIAALNDGSDVTYWGQLRLDVSGRDVDDVVLPLRRTAAMSGRVEWAPGSTPAERSMVPVLEPADGRRSLGLFTPTRTSAGPITTFVFHGLMAGEYVLRVGIGSRYTQVESITWEGRDYIDRPFDASDGKDISGVVLTLTSHTASISGVVGDGVAGVTSGAAVIVFPVERERWSNYGLNPQRIKSVLTTSDGRYRVEGLPVGDYYLVAVPAAQEHAWFDPAFFASHAGRAARVRVERSDTKISDFSLSLVK